MPLSLRQRFEAKVDRSGGPDACHPWMGTCRQDGYGVLRVEGRLEYAHRVAWRLAGHEITPEKPCVLHNCPNGDLPACCNERHLWDGTRTENQRDMARKGRGRKSKQGLPFGASPNGRGFEAKIRVNGNLIHLGTHYSAERASVVATEAKRLALC